MRASAYILGLPLFAMLSACIPPARQPPETSPPPIASVNDGIPTDAPNLAQCGADKLASFIDFVPTDAVLARIKAQIGDKPIRVINPGDAVTMDFRADRLNIENGANGRIKKFGCY